MNSDNSCLLLNCRFCHHTEPLLENSTIIINTHLPSHEKKFEHFINPYTKFDPSLPRVHNVDCMNMACLSHGIKAESEKVKEIIYIRYDHQNMKYLYLCPVCDYSWKAN